MLASLGLGITGLGHHRTCVGKKNRPSDTTRQRKQHVLFPRRFPYVIFIIYLFSSVVLAWRTRTERIATNSRGRLVTVARSQKIRAHAQCCLLAFLRTETFFFVFVRSETRSTARPSSQRGRLGPHRENTAARDSSARRDGPTGRILRRSFTSRIARGPKRAAPRVARPPPPVARARHVWGLVGRGDRSSDLSAAAAAAAAAESSSTSSAAARPHELFNVIIGRTVCTIYIHCNASHAVQRRRRALNVPPNVRGVFSRVTRDTAERVQLSLSMFQTAPECDEIMRFRLPRTTEAWAARRPVFRRLHAGRILLLLLLLSLLLIVQYAVYSTRRARVPHVPPRTLWS